MAQEMFKQNTFLFSIRIYKIMIGFYDSFHNEVEETNTHFIAQSNYPFPIPLVSGLTKLHIKSIVESGFKEKFQINNNEKLTTMSIYRVRLYYQAYQYISIPG